MEETLLLPPGCSRAEQGEADPGRHPHPSLYPIREKAPSEKRQMQNVMISSWEQKNNCMMPEDMKNFYLMTNGVRIPLASMAVNSISKLTQLSQSSMYSLPYSPARADPEDDTCEASEDQPEKLRFDPCSVIFEWIHAMGMGRFALPTKLGNQH